MKLWKLKNTGQQNTAIMHYNNYKQYVSSIKILDTISTKHVLPHSVFSKLG